MMETTEIKIGKVPAILWGRESGRCWLCLHGQGGRKEDAAAFAALAEESGAQTLSLDLPEHGARKGQEALCVPWQAVPEIQAAADWVRERWQWLGLRGESLGAWFGLLALERRPPERALFVSPVLDMAALIEDMMTWAGVTAERLEREREIPTDFGQTLSWTYFRYAAEHPIQRWPCPTDILCASADALIRRETVETFSGKFQANLTVVNGEHWFHTPQQLEALTDWTRARLKEPPTGRRKEQT